jgi:DNA mismatch repair protein MSH5
LIKGIDVDCLQNIGNSINRIVDFEGLFLKISLNLVENGGRTAIKSGIDEELDLLQERYHGLNEFLGKVAVQVYQSLCNYINCDADQLNVIYFPQV